MERHERLRKARIDAGFQSAAQAARRLDVPYGTYSGHENGLRGILQEDVQRYARAFNVPLAWLALGQEDAAQTFEVEIAGEIQVGGIINENPRECNWTGGGASFHPAALNIMMPKDVFAYVVDGKGCQPYLRDADLLVVRKLVLGSYQFYDGDPHIIQLESDGVKLYADVYWINDRTVDFFNMSTGWQRSIRLSGAGEIVLIVPARQVDKATTDAFDYEMKREKRSYKTSAKRS